MMGDMGGGQLFSGSAMMALLIYALVSVFGTGPLIGERLAQKRHWEWQCKKLVLAESTNNGDGALPSQACGMASILGPGWSKLCSDVTAPIEALKQQQLHNARRAMLPKAKSRCGCAVNEFIAKNRISLGLMAGSLTVISPASVSSNIDAELQSGLRSSACSMKG